MSLDYKRKRNIMRSFKRRGLALQPSALEAMMNVLQRESPESAPMILESILDNIKECMMKSVHPTKGGGNVVTAAFLAQVIADLTRDGADVTAEALQLLDAVETPRLHFDTMKRRFRLLRSSEEERSAFGNAEDKVSRFILNPLTLSQVVPKTMKRSICYYKDMPWFNNVCFDKTFSGQRFQCQMNKMGRTIIKLHLLRVSLDEKVSKFYSELFYRYEMTL